MAPSLLFVVQVLLALAALPLCVTSLMTSQRRRSRQRRLRLGAIVLIALAIVAMMATMIVAADPEDADYWLALGTPFVTFLLCGVTIRRSGRPPSGHSGRFGPTTM
jgi:hypothetical protein